MKSAKYLKAEYYRLKLENQQLRLTINRLQRPDNWFIVYRDFWLVMNQLTALFLCDLFNIRGMKKAKVKPDGSFMCTQQYLVRRGWSLQQQKTLFGNLKRNGWVTTQVRGKDTRRWVTIHEDGLNAVVNDRKAAQSTLGCAQPNVDGCAQPKKKNKDSLRNPETLSGVPTSPPATAAAPDAEGDMFDGLVANYNTPANPRVTPAPQDYTYATRLKTVLADRLSMRKGWSRSKWADEFRVLRKELAGDEERLSAVLDWYLKHAGDEYVPQAFSAAAFRRKFADIEKQMLRASKRITRDAPATVSPAATKVLDRVKTLTWPKGSDRQLAGFVQRSLDAHRELVAKMTDPKFAGKDSRSLAGFHDRFKSVAGWGPKEISSVSFVAHWAERVNEEVCRWDEWSGDLSPYVFSPAHRLFVRDAEDLAVRYSGSTTLWDRYKKEVGL